MADKEIIINGINVSKCEYRDWRNFCCCNNSKENEGEERVTGRGGCKYNPNCHYKQLKRKEQALDEIERIAEENIRISDLEGLNGVYRRGLAEQILQKISEREVNND